MNASKPKTARCDPLLRGAVPTATTYLDDLNTGQHAAVRAGRFLSGLTRGGATNHRVDATNGLELVSAPQSLL